MAVNPRDMDGFMPLLSTTDIKKKLNVGSLLLNYLGDATKSIECQDIGQFIDNIIPWLSNGNPKVVQNGLEILTFLADRMGHDFKPYISTIIQPTIDRLGDSKDATREKAQLVLLKIMEKGCMSPQQLLDRLRPAFSHKNAKLREEALILLTTTLNEHGADEMILSGVIPSIVKLLSDPSEKVRETALNTLADIYRHVGERLRVDLQRKHNVPQAKLLLLIEKFDQLKAAGDLLPLAMSSDVGKTTDETDRAIKSAPVKRLAAAAAAAPPKRGQFGPAKAPSSALAQPGNTSSMVPRATTVKRNVSVKPTPGQAGAVDEETFLTAFEDVPSVNLFSAKDLEEQMKIIRENVGDDKKDWKQRTESMKKLRAIVIAGGTNYENFLENLKSVQRSFEVACTDLRSQVVREACITLAFLSQQLKNKFASFGEAVLLTLMNLIQNSAKVVATAGAVAVRFILQNTHYSRFVPIITSCLSHKSKDIRRASCEYLNLILQIWPTQILQKHLTILQDTIKKGIADSDSEARAFARKSYWAFKDHFPEQAEALLNSLDTAYKRSLMSLSNSGSINSLNVVTRSASVSPRTSRPVMSATDRATPGVRSTSAIDLQAAQRAKARMMYANMSRQKASLPRPSKSPDTTAVASPERTARTRTRVSGVSQSQPSSRSGSPSSRLSYATYNREGESLIARPRRLSGHGIRSTGNSREPSPQRFGMDRSFASKIRGRSLHMSPTDRPQSRPVMAQKMLQQSREAESALADALTFENIDNYPRTPRGKGDHSDDSETSSICSERSMDSFRRPNDSFSWSGSQQRLYRDMWDQSIPKDIKEIIENCAHKHWGDRKEGLVGLQHFLSNGNTLTATELRKVTDIFTKMFMDSHTKVFSLFLDTLNELVATHSEDLGDWLYVLCARLLNKLGTDLLGSIQAKIHKTLEVVRECFPGEQLLPAVMRYLTDPTQTPNSRVKIATLVFITQIAETAEPSALINSAGTALARLLDWSNDVKSQDVRRHAQNAVISLYNLNPPKVTMILAELPKYYQEAALPLVQNHLRKSSGSSNPASPGTPPPRAQSSPARSKGKGDIDNADENLEEVYKSLRRTTAEIQNYGFERLERATTSKDSGISNMADVEEKMEGLTLCNSGRSSSVSSPTQRGRSVTNITVNGSSDTIAGDLILPQENNGYKTHGSSPDSIKRPEVLDNMIKTLQSKMTQTEEKVSALQEFQLYVREGDALYIKQNFKKLLKTLLDSLTNDSKKMQVEVLQTLIDMLKCPELVDSFSVYPELLVLKVINAYKLDDQKQDSSTSSNSRSPVLWMAEKCAATIAMVLKPEQVIHLVSTIITTEPYPLNMGAIKMLHKVVEHWGRDAIEPHLSKVMPGLIKAYDDNESAVRKSAVFCMVAIHLAVGEELLKPHLSCLYTSKLKLLNIYIQRAQQANSQPASPRSNSKN
ncbi:CLIP-associating protein 1-A isoform X4 [Bombus vosnesenskii]|uniref:CLIP-associating protein 1-A isoform X4 n=2 Tax=Pyrobombus TaxID=144703 RepID=A0A6J3K8I7_9HYME|nr:CLIP-associating protein 1-A isoform X4 [Bombus vancouverensis nearcticus]XP_033302900.1 CLIP-associating protein 1-A isoform X4 [Bombus bifarius]XP_033349423.1 CLIP-associating protein 1-A isoform X4 [Bombus vosnesenskii]